MFRLALLAGALLALPSPAVGQSVAACGTLKPKECDREARRTYESDRALGYRMFLAACELRSAVSCHMLGLIEERAGRSGQAYFVKGCDLGHELSCDRVEDAEIAEAVGNPRWLNLELGGTFAYETSSLHSFGAALRYTPVIPVSAGYLDFVPFLGADVQRRPGGAYFTITEIGAELLIPVRFWKPEIFLSLGGGIGITLERGATDVHSVLGAALGYRYAKPKLGFIDRVAFRYDRHVGDPGLSVFFAGLGLDF